MSMLFTLNAAVYLAWGLLFMLLPGFFCSGLGMSVNTGVLAVARLLGAAQIGTALLSWWVREEEYSPTRTAVFKTQSVAWGLTAVVGLHCALSGIWNLWGRINVLVLVAGTLVWGYLAWLRPEGP
jgi:hypothetical protein